MITLTIPDTQPKTLYEACKRSIDGIDAYDKDWDGGAFFDCPETWEDADGDYDKLMLLFGCNIQVDEYDPDDNYAACCIADFMWENRDVFEPFLNASNRKGYRPMDYDDLDPELDTGFYEVYLQSFEALLAGNYSDEQYAKLYKKLAAKAATKNSEKLAKNSK